MPKSPRKNKAALILEAVGLPQATIATELGVSKPYVSRTLAKHMPALETQAMVKRPNLVERLDELTFRVTDRLDRELDQAKAHDLQALATTSGILIDKAQLLKGQPTAILGHLEDHRRDIPEIIGRLLDLRQRIVKSRPADPLQAPPADSPQGVDIPGKSVNDV